MGAVLSNQTETPLAFRLITKPPFLLVDLDPSTNREEMTRAYATEFQTLRPQHNLPASTFVLIFIEKHLHINHIGGVMVNIPLLCGRSWVEVSVEETKDYKTGICCFSAE